MPPELADYTQKQDSAQTPSAPLFDEKRREMRGNTAMFQDEIAQTQILAHSDTYGNGRANSDRNVWRGDPDGWRRWRSLRWWWLCDNHARVRRRVVHRPFAAFGLL